MEKRKGRTLAYCRICLVSKGHSRGANQSHKIFSCSGKVQTGDGLLAVQSNSVISTCSRTMETIQALLEASDNSQIVGVVGIVFGVHLIPQERCSCRSRVGWWKRKAAEMVPSREEIREFLLLTGE